MTIEPLRELAARLRPPSAARQRGTGESERRTLSANEAMEKRPWMPSTHGDCATIAHPLDVW
jgi:hypothetical protein